MKFKELVNCIRFPCYMLIRYLEDEEVYIITDNTSDDFIKYTFSKINDLVDIIGEYEVKNFNKIDNDCYSILLIKR